jgi:hypothetical protein
MQQRQRGTRINGSTLLGGIVCIGNEMDERMPLWEMSVSLYSSTCLICMPPVLSVPSVLSVLSIQTTSKTAFWRGSLRSLHLWLHFHGLNTAPHDRGLQGKAWKN